eukprot:2551823-Pyramimonas_sp.AAC.1
MTSAPTSLRRRGQAIAPLWPSPGSATPSRPSRSHLSSVPRYRLIARIIRTLAPNDHQQDNGNARHHHIITASVAHIKITFLNV